MSVKPAVIAALMCGLIEHSLVTTSGAHPIKPFRAKQYLGNEAVPVTLPASSRLSRKRVMKNVGSKTAVFIILNQSGRDFESFQLKITTEGSSTTFAKITSHGAGSLLRGEKRIIKAGNRAPFQSINIVWGPIIDSKVAHFTGNFQGGIPYLFTINKDNSITMGRW